MRASQVNQKIKSNNECTFRKYIILNNNSLRTII